MRHADDARQYARARGPDIMMLPSSVPPGLAMRLRGELEEGNIQARCPGGAM
jgi:hypothetical protein